MSAEDYLRKIDYWRDMYKECAVGLNVSRKAHKETQTVYQKEIEQLQAELEHKSKVLDDVHAELDSVRTLGNRARTEADALRNKGKE